MEVMQFPIKINQTNLTDGGRQKSTSKTNAPVNSFDQILARYNFSGRTLASDRQSADSTIQNESDKEDNRLIEQTFPSKEDWLELDSIMAALIAGIQHGQYSQETSQDSDKNLFSANQSLIPAKSPMAGSQKQTNTDDSIGLAQWFQKVENTNPTAILNQTQLIQRLGKLIGELQSQDKQNSIEVPIDSADKIQLVLDESKTGNKFVGTTPIIRFFDNEIQSVSLNSIQNGKAAASPLQNISEPKGNVQTDLTKLSPEDRRDIDTSLVSETKQGQHIHTTPREVLENYSGSESQTTELSAPLADSLEQGTSDPLNALAYWLQKVEGIYQAPTSDSSKLIQRLAYFIGELQVQEKQNSIEIPINIGGKIQMMLDDVLMSPSSLFSHFVQREPNQDDQSISQNESISLINQQQKSEGWNVSKAVTSTPILNVSEFVPQVSGWIGGYLRSTNGQLGSTEARFSLYPEHLGHIEIKITSQQGQISAQILAETGLAKEALEGQLHQLRQALQQHGLQVKNLEIVQQTPVSMDANQANLAFSQGDSSSPHQQRTFTENQNVSKKQNGSDETEMEKEHLSVPYGGAAPKKATQIDFTA